jgi:hypothetical protein
MNRSFLIVLVPAIAVAAGYIVTLTWLGYQLEPWRFILAGSGVVAAILIVLRYQRRKASRRSR